MLCLFFIMASRGSELEKKADKVNLSKRLSKEALILKIPVPIIRTRNGLIPKPSTVDFAGLIQGGTFIAFDAKETKVKTRFDLSNIHQHQVEYLNAVRDLGGIAFFLIWFKEVDKKNAYVVPLSLVNHYYWDETKRQSIPFDDFNQYAIKVNLTKYLEFLENDKFKRALFSDERTKIPN